MNALDLCNWFGWSLLSASALYALASMTAALLGRRSRQARWPVPAARPVTILKPLCGAEPRLYENLRSFCLQDYPAYQLIFGTRDADDPALAVAKRLQAEFSHLDIDVLCDQRIHGSNLKVSNLLNLLPHARHDWLVIVDSDINVATDYLARVTAPLSQPDVGLVTCLYRGHALPSVWARLGKQFIDDWFAPSVEVVNLFGFSGFGFGSTLALRRDALDAIDGLQALLGHLADDNRLSRLTRDHGLRTILADCEVTTDVTEHRLRDLVAHELRWLRTIRLIQPLGYFFGVITFTVPIAVSGFVLSGAHSAAAMLLFVTLISRAMLHYLRVERGTLKDVASVCEDFTLLMIRDTLSLALWAGAFFGRRVSWRGQQLSTHRGGYARASSEASLPQSLNQSV